MDRNEKRAYDTSHMKPALRNFKDASDIWAKGLAQASKSGITARQMPGDLSVAINKTARACEQWYSAWVNEQPNQRGPAESRSWFPALQQFQRAHDEVAALFVKIRAVIGMSENEGVNAQRAQMGGKDALDDRSRYTNILPASNAMFVRAGEIPHIKAARELNQALFSSRDKFADACNVVGGVTKVARGACGR
jgi:hypothetical protein